MKIKCYIVLLGCLIAPLSVYASVAEEHALRLNSILEKALKQLDELTSILEYVGQALDKGAIKVADKPAALTWIAHNKKIVKTVKKSHVLPLEETQLHSMLFAAKLLTKHVMWTIDNTFNNIIDLDVSVLVKRSTLPVTITAVEELSQENAELLLNLRDEANKAGLTTINLIARQLDDWNSKYSILKNIKNLCISTITSAIGLYFAPRKWFTTGLLKDTPLANLKENYIGTSQFDPDIRDDHRRLKKDEQKRQYSGWVDRILDATQSTEITSAITLVGGTYLLIKNPTLLSPKIADLGRKISDYWDNLKGFSVPNKASYEVVEDVDLDSECLIGIDNQIEELRNLVRYITNPEFYDRTNSNLEKGILLTGPSRTGKTLVARALAGTLDKAFKDQGYNTRVGFKELKPEEVKWSSEGIKSIIQQAKQMAPCVLFIDEIHNLPLQTKEGDTLTEFLTGMSGVNSENDARHQVILLAATNQPEMLDGALLQPGRFGTIIRFEKPSYSNRKKYFEVMFKRNSIDTTEIDIALLVRQTEGCSYGDLETIIKNARFIARTLAKGVTQEHLQDRIDKHVHRLRNDLPSTEQEKRVIASHLAGQALAYIILETERKLEFVTLKGRWPKIKEGRLWDIKQRQMHAKSHVTKWGYICTYNSTETLKLETLVEKEKLSKIKLAGIVAEKIIMGSSSYSYRPDEKHKAFLLAKAIILDGMQEKDLPKTEQQKISQEAFVLLKKYEQEIITLLTEHTELIKKITQELETKITLTAHQICAIIKDNK